MPTLTSKLEAVNSMLGHIGESPVNSISDTNALPISAATAISVLDEVSRSVQAEGWHFNTELKVTLSPAGDGTITLSDDILEVDTIDTSIDIAQRGLSLFDRSNNTSVFSKDLEVNLTRLLDFTSLPEAARRYITLRASRVFQGRIVGSRELEALIARDEYNARADLMDTEGNNSDRTIFDSYNVASRIGINRNYDLS
jgi:pantothenate kinase